MSTGLTPDLRPNQYRTALSAAAAHAATTAATFTQDGGHPLHRVLEGLDDAWSSNATARMHFEWAVLNCSRRAANALDDHTESLHSAVDREPPVVDPAGPLGWKSRYIAR